MRTTKLPTSISSIYFVGIKGVGMSSLAILAKEAGFIVAGSDIAVEFITDHALKQKNIISDRGFDTVYIETFLKNKKIDETLVIVTAAHNGLSNPQAVFAADHGFTVISHGQAVGDFMKGAIFRRDMVGISVAGSHGKTTISAMAATYLSKLGQDPSYTVGTSDIFPLGSAGHYGQGIYFVAEADEYISDIEQDRTPKLLYQNPTYAIINNIDFDHPDFYESVEKVEETFEIFLKNIKSGGALFLNADDPHTPHLLKKVPKELSVLSYGKSENAQFQLRNFKQFFNTSEFDVYHNGNYYSKFFLKVPGEHNCLNALSVIALLDTIGFSANEISNITKAFLGVKRRIEILGKTEKGAIVIDDYAHHPKEIETSLKTLKSVYTDKKVICIFQPHTYSRLNMLLSQFAGALLVSDEIILLPVYASARENYEGNKDDLIDSLHKLLPGSIFLYEKVDVIEYVKKNFDSASYVIVTMGAGDVYKINEKLITNNRKL